MLEELEKHCRRLNVTTTALKHTLADLEDELAEDESARPVEDQVQLLEPVQGVSSTSHDAAEDTPAGTEADQGGNPSGMEVDEANTTQKPVADVDRLEQEQETVDHEEETTDAREVHAETAVPEAESAARNSLSRQSPQQPDEGDTSQPADDELANDPNKTDVNLQSLSEIAVNDVTYHEGEYAYIQNDEFHDQPHVVLIHALWKDLRTEEVKIRFEKIL